jgi:hypothetical protein
MSFAPDLAAPAAPPGWRGEGVAEDVPVATPRGMVPAGALAPGDAVLGVGGAVLRVASLRREAMAGEAFRRLGLPAPVRIMAGALGLGPPRADVVLGPAQAVRLGGAAVAAELLVDGGAVRRVAADARLVAPRFEGAGTHGWRAGGLVLADAPSLDGAARAAALMALPRPSGPLEGYVEFADRFGVLGWARDASRPEAVVAVEVVALDTADRVLARVAADRPRPDLVRGGVAAPGEGLARHGFAARFATPLPAGRAWLLAVRRAGGEAMLPGCPVLVDGAGSTPEGFALALAAVDSDAAPFLAGLAARAAAARLRA